MEWVIVLLVLGGLLVAWWQLAHRVLDPVQVCPVCGRTLRADDWVEADGTQLHYACHLADDGPDRVAPLAPGERRKGAAR